jgi:hypothetical protein
MQANNPNSSHPAKARFPDDGTRQLLQWGGSMLGAGILAAVLLETVLGGFSPTGASTNTGWFALIVALMCIPFGGLLRRLAQPRLCATGRLSVNADRLLFFSITGVARTWQRALTKSFF